MKMKFLQWVHHKVRHSCIEPLKDLNIAQPSVDGHDSYMNSTFGSRYGSTSLEPPTRDQDESEAKGEDETSAINSELFHGFLTIGTLGSEPSINEPETPTFATTSENLTAHKTEVTENNLKLITYELEKFLEAETKEEVVRASSARNSHVSTITLSGNQMEESEDEEHWTTAVCPLKVYHCGSSTELPETRIEAKKERTSLKELFDRTKTTTENFKEKSESQEIEAKHKHKSAKEMKAKHKHKSAMQFMKKMIKKLHASPKCSAPSTEGDAIDPVSIKKKLDEASDSVPTKNKPHKVLRMFYRRIHPESCIAAREFVKSEKFKDKNNSSAGDGGCDENMMLMGRDNRRFPQGEIAKEGTEHCKIFMNLPQCRLSGSNSRRGERWIKTDADYLVLEL